MSQRADDGTLRILHVLNHSHRLNGNVHAAIDLACAQAQLGHRVTLCSGGGSFDDLLRANGVEVVQLVLARRPLALVRAVRVIAGLCRRVDVVHAHMMTSALIAWLACLRRRVPLVTTVHNAFERSAIVMGLGRRVIAVSAAVGRSMKARGIPARRLRVVLNGTIGAARLGTQPELPQRSGAPRLVFVGGLHPRKGVADLLDAFERVHDLCPDALLTIVGEGPYATAYAAQAASSRCAGAVTFAGGQSDPRPFLAEADIFVLPSLADPAPLVLSEAREAACAVVATAVDGIPELLEQGRAGLLVPPGDPARLAAALLPLVADPAECARWQRNSQINVEHLSVARVARDTMAIYAECVRPMRALTQTERAGARPCLYAREDRSA